MENKKLFVEELGRLFDKHNVSNVARMEYRKPGVMYNEEVYVYYKDRVTYSIVNVSCDSLLAIVKDLIKQEALW